MRRDTGKIQIIFLIKIKDKIMPPQKAKIETREAVEVRMGKEKSQSKIKTNFA